MRNRVSQFVADETYRLARDVYVNAGAADQFQIASVENSSQAVLDLLLGRIGSAH